MVATCNLFIIALYYHKHAVVGTGYYLLLFILYHLYLTSLSLFGSLFWDSYWEVETDIIAGVPCKHHYVLVSSINEHM